MLEILAKDSRLWFSDQLAMEHPTSSIIPDAASLWRIVFDAKLKLFYERINERDVLRQLLLHLPRFTVADIVNPDLIESEIKRLVQRISFLRKDAPAEFKPPKAVLAKLHRTRLDLVNPSIAEFVHKTYHYIGSARGGGIHLGLYSDSESSHKSRLLSIITLSPFDLAHIADSLPCGLSQEQVLVLSRLFAFDWCPRNTVSYTLGRVFSWLRERLPHIKMLITYLNPNLGFQGTVYKATNWVLFGREKKRRYLYLDSDYISDRCMIRAYGNADLQKLRAILGDRVSSSVIPLRPLEIYAYFLDPVMRRNNILGFNHEFFPPSELVGGVTK